MCSVLSPGSVLRGDPWLCLGTKCGAGNCTRVGRVRGVCEANALPAVLALGPDCCSVGPCAGPVLVRRGQRWKTQFQRRLPAQCFGAAPVASFFSLLSVFPPSPEPLPTLMTLRSLQPPLHFPFSSHLWALTRNRLFIVHLPNLKLPLAPHLPPLWPLWPKAWGWPAPLSLTSHTSQTVLWLPHRVTRGTP